MRDAGRTQYKSRVLAWWRTKKSSAAIFVVFGAAYALALALGEHLYGSLAVPSPFWLPDAVLLCALLSTPKDTWWWLLVEAWVLRLFPGPVSGTPLWFSVSGIANDSLKALAGAWILQPVLGRPVRFRTLREFMLFLGVAALALPFASALAAAPLRHALGDPLWSAGYRWFLGDAVAQVIVTPALLLWLARGYRNVAAGTIEWLSLAGGLLILLYVAFVMRHDAASPLMLYAPIPLLMWAAVRTRPFGTANVLVLVAIIAMVSASQGSGVFAGGSTERNVLSIQLYLLMVGVSSLSLAILIGERESAARELQTVLNAVPAPVLIATDPECHHIVANPTGYALYQRPIGTNLAKAAFPAGAPFRVLRGGVEIATEELPLQRAARGIAVSGESWTLALADGTTREMIGNAVPLVGPEGSVRGAVATFLDITELRLAEQQLQELSGRLIDAQEQERARIARELHDDIGQRLAMLQVNVDLLGQGSALPLERREQLGTIADGASDIAEQIHRLSHQLHPSILETLGLVTALARLCRELSEQHQLNVTFVHRDVPDSLALEVRACAFRITQEALRNVVKHSGVSEARVELAGDGEMLSLSVSDRGAGFDPGAVVGRPGLGLVSMRERLRPIGGRLTIYSAPSRGTRIEISMRANPAARLSEQHTLS